MINASDLAQLVVWSELVEACGIINRVSHATAPFDYGEAGDVAWPVCDVKHVLERDAPVLRRDVGIDVDGGVFVCALVDLEQSTRFRRVVDHHADLRNLSFGADIELALLHKAGLQGVLNKFAPPDAVHMAGDGAAADHLGQAGAHDVVLQLDLMLAVGFLLVQEGFRAVEKFWQAGIEFYLGAALAQNFVVQSMKPAGDYVGEQVVEI